MNGNVTMRVRLGVLALFIAALLFGFNIVLRGPSVNPSVDPAGFANSATAGIFIPAWLLSLVATILAVFGLLALYTYFAGGNLERWALMGMLLSVAGYVLIAPLFGFMALATPTIAELYIQGQTAVIQVAEAIFAGAASLTVLSLSALLYTVGSVLFAVAIWRSGMLPKWSAIPYAVQAPLISVAITFETELLGAVLLIISSGWIAWRIWKQPAAA